LAASTLIEESDMQRSGIAPNWKTATAIAKHGLKNWALDKANDELERNLNLLNSFICYESIYIKEFSPVERMIELTGKKRTRVMFALGVTARPSHYSFETGLLLNKSLNEWLSDARFCTNRRYSYIVNELYPSSIETSFEKSVSHYCRCLYLGWNNRAEQLIQLITSTYRRQGFFDVTEIRGESLYNWLYRVALAHYGIEFTDWPKDTYTLAQALDHGDRAPKVGDQIEPVLNFMYDIWDKPDLSGDAELILNFCDYYTHRCKVKQGYEFNNNWVEMRFPFIILAWFKLRQMRGLPIPEIDHPLLQTNPAAHFIPEQPYPKDEVLHKVLARLKAEELPDLILV
jgi:hypothetical protein